MTAGDTKQMTLGGLSITAIEDANGNYNLGVAVSGASGGGVVDGAVSVANGADVTQGALGDAAVITDASGSLSGKLRGLVKWAFERMPASLGQKTKAASLPVVLASDQGVLDVTGSTVSITGAVTVDAGTNLNTSALATNATLIANGVLAGAVNETAASSDTNTSGLNGRLQRIAQRITSLIALLPTSLGQKTVAASLAVVVASDQSAIPVSAGTNLNTSALALETTQAAANVLTGAVTETAPASDTASSGLNGRLQRIAQRLTSLIALLPASLGQKSMAAALAVTIADDQTSIPTGDVTVATVLGTTSDAAVTTDANGSVNAHLRGIVALLAQPSSSAVNTPSIVTTASGDAIGANAARKLASITNLGTNPLYIRLATAASVTVFHYVLQGCVVADDGSGGVWSDDLHKGVVSVAGTSPRFTVCELT